MTRIIYVTEDDITKLQNNEVLPCETDAVDTVGKCFIVKAETVEEAFEKYDKYMNVPNNIK